MKKKKIEKIITMIFFIIVMVGAIYFHEGEENKGQPVSNQMSYDIANLPEYQGEIYVAIHDNHPTFTEEDVKIEKDNYSDLVKGRVRDGDDKNKLGKSKCR